MFAARWYLATAALVAALFLAVARPSSGAGPEERYVVKPGDTLWALAEQRFGGDPREGVWRISERNELEGSSLQPGMVLYLPAPGGDA
ncbi:MAG: LysM peptidoglycan-binding domain-containing protein [Gaiellaceae bacterium]